MFCYDSLFFLSLLALILFSFGEGGEGGKEEKRHSLSQSHIPSNEVKSRFHLFRGLLSTQLLHELSNDKMNGCDFGTIHETAGGSLLDLHKVRRPTHIRACKLETHDGGVLCACVCICVCVLMVEGGETYYLLFAHFGDGTRNRKRSHRLRERLGLECQLRTSQASHM